MKSIKCESTTASLKGWPLNNSSTDAFTFAVIDARRSRRYWEDDAWAANTFCESRITSRNFSRRKKGHLFTGLALDGIKTRLGGLGEEDAADACRMLDGREVTRESRQ